MLIKAKFVDGPTVILNVFYHNICGAKYVFLKGCFPKILLGPFLNTLTHT